MWHLITMRNEQQNAQIRRNKKRILKYMISNLDDPKQLLMIFSHNSFRPHFNAFNDKPSLQLITLHLLEAHLHHLAAITAASAVEELPQLNLHPPVFSFDRDFLFAFDPGSLLVSGFLMALLQNCCACGHYMVLQLDRCLWWHHVQPVCTVRDFHDEIGSIESVWR